MSFVMKDANCETGWIELKIVDSLLENKPNRFKYYTAAQEDWLFDHAAMGIPTFLLIVVHDSREWLWFAGIHAKNIQGRSGAELRAMAVFKGADPRSLAPELIRRCNRNRRIEE